MFLRMHSGMEFGTMLYINDAVFYFITANAAHATTENVYYVLSLQVNWNRKIAKSSECISIANHMIYLGFHL